MTAVEQSASLCVRNKKVKGSLGTPLRGRGICLPSSRTGNSLLYLQQPQQTPQLPSLVHFSLCPSRKVSRAQAFLGDLRVGGKEEPPRPGF